jgi:hypothetical protein
VEHIIPRSLVGKERDAALVLHGLPADFDLEGVDHVAPSCSLCNGVKGDRVPHDAPIIRILLETARQKAPGIRAAAEQAITQAKVAKAFGVLHAALGPHQSAEVRNLMASSLGEIRSELERVSSILAANDAIPDFQSPEEAAVRLHPALTPLNIAGRWRVIHRLPNEVVVLQDDSGRSGYTGKHLSFTCARCGSDGPWSGSRCMACGVLDDGVC